LTIARGEREKSEKWRQEGFKIVRKAISKFKIKIRNLVVPIGLPIRFVGISDYEFGSLKE